MNAEMICPKPLLPGDTVAMIGISGCIQEDHPEIEAEKAAEKLRGLGFHVVIGDTCTKQNGYYAGTDAERAAALMDAFADETIDGIFCMRGGMGAIRILDLVDWTEIRRHPKAFVGFSDITAVHTVLQDRCGLQTFHGPMPLGTGISEENAGNLMSILAGQVSGPVQNLNGTPLTSLRAGEADGILTGGNLSLLTAVCGTRYDLDTKDKILFIEEVEEKPYKVDRMLSQLELAGKLSRCAGIIFGGFTDCEETEFPQYSVSVPELLEEWAARLKIPVVAGLQAGHVENALTLPFGRRVHLSGDTAQLIL